jgi:hypothetical protein
MCRNIKVLFNFAPAVTDAEIQAAALQYVRKVSGMAKPSMANQAVFDHAVNQVAVATHALLDTLVTTATERNREAEIVKAKIRSQQRFSQS